ncbi:unnamed protein product [Gongylonema pulchrum]|uniref:Small basic protein n=1 Tax=Gongylonema pulchrum TaxID=637853 RepID=A0A183DGV7_9BILA|nr:unnamed protein product [Gongylonema pulchrum]
MTNMSVDRKAAARRVKANLTSPLEMKNAKGRLIPRNIAKPYCERHDGAQVKKTRVPKTKIPHVVEQQRNKSQVNPKMSL